ncbi:hypothetical protein [Emticicia sp. 17c]|uniref:hypothetical protein n=1 Tax=Emticicia sp. 17c TaxID=3127704 RepID=UPI00301DC046
MIPKHIPVYTIEQLNSCDANIKMNVDIRRLEEHVKNSAGVHFHQGGNMAEFLARI